MTHIAQEAGVSVAVVSRLLRGDPTLRISERRRREVLETKDRLGGVSTRLRKRRLTRTILAPVNRIFSAGPSPVQFAAGQFARSLEAALEREKFRLHFAFFDQDQQRAFFESHIRARTHCDGLLLLSGIVDEWLAQMLRTHDCPHVSNDYHAERFRVNTVRAHTADGLRQAVEHLQELGHRRIGFLGPRGGYRHPLTVLALTAQGLNLAESDICWLPPLPAGSQEIQWRDPTREAFGRWLAHPRAVTAMICSNDWIALGALDAMRARGLVPGRDLSLVGHDNLEQRDAVVVAHPILTTVDSPYDLIGRRAGELLLNQVLHGQDQVVHERIPVPLIVRETTGPARARTQTLAT